MRAVTYAPDSRRRSWGPAALGIAVATALAAAGCGEKQEPPIHPPTTAPATTTAPTPTTTTPTAPNTTTKPPPTGTAPKQTP